MVKIRPSTEGVTKHISIWLSSFPLLFTSLALHICIFVTWSSSHSTNVPPADAAQVTKDAQITLPKKLQQDHQFLSLTQRQGKRCCQGVFRRKDARNITEKQQTFLLPRQFPDNVVIDTLEIMSKLFVFPLTTSIFLFVPPSDAIVALENLLVCF